VANQIIWKSPSLSGSPIVRERDPEAEHLLLFSDVFFNLKRTVALVNRDSWCGVSRWIALEKGKDGVWQTRPWARCVAVA
jgi:hypothetical protein